MHKILLALAISVLLTPTAAFAQTPPANEGRDETILLPPLQFPTGILREAVNRALVPLTALPPVMRQQQRGERGWPGRHPVLFGALVGLGVGVALEAATIAGHNDGEPDSGYIPIVAAMGTSIGSLTGLIVSVARR